MSNNDLEVGYKCCFTGYRPSKFPFSLNPDVEEYKKLENALIEQILSLCEEGCHTFYSGMAMGFDIIAAETVLLLKKAYKSANLRLVCVLPFEKQGESFTSYWRSRFNKVLEEADEVIVLADDYFIGCYQKRNEYMVDNTDFVITWYDGKTGGTKNTIDYALRNQRFVFNINKDSRVRDFGMQTVIEII